jgi:PAS domain-containing protein
MVEPMEIDASPFLACFLVEARTVHCLAASADGTVRGCNAAMTAALKATPEELDGRPLWGLLTEADAASLRQRVSTPEGDASGKFLLNFVDAGHSPFTLECRCEVRPDGFLLLGELPDARAFQEEWLHMNNQLAVLGRENARRAKELERAKAELEQALRNLEGSYWHLKKIQEVLPICMDCRRVKAGTEWEGVAQYLKEHALFLSHGYCPDCLAKALAKLGIQGREALP